MNTLTIERTGLREPAADPVADLRAAHLAAGVSVAGLDLDDRRLWRRLDPIVAELATSAYKLAAAVTGERPGAAAVTGVPPVVRVRELASAQRRLFAALAGHPVPPAELVAQASREVHRLGRQLNR